ncbi:bifunctional phosphoglucose / phosphomannose isomerase [Aeropyrum pernix K1]|uniref:Bifunctional phosphoglucose/phosphomannose isomerase n=1 Tax=Aeropyrum pernix (strain ATCC 700893 / DSM 11879 / JCM 9820 / NBRC 100138 / K1) TaxID=272557 RepID=PGMI_AERPE|nr:RecName: Full=Bifunctional phosphoglucose/phosphomannose isomerase; AltName: Full=Glucose-6-phosphate isomerase; Short=GPI; AltName: Full=Mannose-6-phosphate isomerase; AltName: Full=Phosphoglucose isomerase; Short=PGI; AltName: Full=Phosphomannose isomerase; Short=PMI [Aeropyrum pernix K1]BAA79746.2 bifunctional phosphoglucose / phosphomannose isomerase [Aeropyrum pernix K1]
MEDLYLSWPKWFSEALARYSSLEGALEGVEEIYYCGMGGSGAAGDYIEALLSIYAPQGPEFRVVKDFRPPRPPRHRGYGLVLASYSGNTLETVECGSLLSPAAGRVVAVTSGGRLLEMAKERGWLVARLPGGILPRVSFPWMLAASTAMLSGALGVDLEALKRLAGGLDTQGLKGEAERLAGFISRYRIASLVTCGPGIPLAVRLKNELAENAKMPSRLEIYPESSHNDIVALEAAEGLYGAVFIWIEHEGSLCPAVLDVVEGIYREYGVDTISIESSARGGPNATVAEYLSRTLVFGLASVRLALMRGFNPEETPPIDKYKRRLGEALRSQA